ncbi:DUF6680 family protein [Bradyrhizobium sp. CER78]|uniref:DUF6680 family protein n=1 Tax=Bradyrhizobium sp. CER78 TaxID=3039162 RepID=UPI0024476DE4|nr:DUF6680 family protein [Bradyrhizobium sp. CER78]MDH2386523.1 hypothetical protein [Bradyrhizobium sp. CER78]
MAEADTFIKFSDIVIATATLLGPILAVQAQKWLEAGREKQARKLTVFRTLMATRATALSPAHVEALNAVPIDFYERKKVVDVWEAYVQHLSSTGPANEVWQQKRSDLLIDLLTTIGNDVGYKFNSAQMHNVYFPQGHGARNEDADAIQIGMAAILRGKASFPIEVKVAPELAALQGTILKGLDKVVNEGGTLNVKVQ